MKLADRIKSGISLYIRYNDWFLFLSCTAAAAYGIILVYSAAASQNGQSREYLVQTVSFLIGVAAALVISRIDYEIICRLWPFLSGISLFLVLLTFTPLGLKVADDQAWLYIPVIGTFQPSELLKITFIISFANHLSKVQHKMNELRTALLLCLHGAVPVLLIFKQGDDGTALVFICIFASMLFIAGLRPLYFLIGATAGAAAVPVAWNMMDELKKARFLCLIFVEKYADNVGWQQNLALIAIGSGKLWGVGYLKGGNQYLYARNTDFIFTVAAGEFGFMGGLALFAILILILLALYRSILAARDLQGMLLCGGLMALIGFQSLINLGMNLRLLPVIGITLPFFSRGGSSLATLFIGVGVALSVYYSGKTRSHDTIFTNNRY
ncbi:MAG TPA: FtsW/RodA/SpoVE family cell cycle protein [Candidatus Avimonas sp.]|nr:FtsW/RodA/SpoVE family cell cycle protein [Clostridiales bacterium]HOB36064.1 FtsW/RodA/SpoVE family cell cycle protein [Candidatus Avimonas sp.]HQA15490.1 FtsW/RodA/SpoVE family cell cycle protein [Candidatus Avimonas sp.]HQD37520.1 FtsW/RodA/SpoVE family cell cycle protein [Candidatus Avimonas sp.]